MLGSAIPRRWTLSLALVGLVSILVATYSAMGANPAFAADSQGTGPGSGTATTLPVADTLSNARVPQGISMLPGDQRVVSVDLIDGNGAVNNNLPDVTYSWGIASGSGITVVGSNTGRSVIVSANSAGSAVFEVKVEQGATTLVNSNFFIRQTTLTVNPVPPTAIPTVAPTNPGPVPSSIPNSQGVLAPEGTLLVNPSGVQTGTNAENSNLNQSPVIFIEKGSVTNFFGVTVAAVDPDDLPAPLPSGVRPGSSAADIKFVDQSGAAQSTFRLIRSAQVCMPVTADDLAAGFQNASLYRYNAVAGQWVKLTTTYNALTMQLCARSSNFSVFAVGVSQVIPTATPGGAPPVTGGWSPTGGLLIFAALVGFVLLGGGAFTMRRARRFDSE